MGTPFEFGLVANTLKEHRWFFNMQLLTGHGYVPTIMPEASKINKISSGIDKKSKNVLKTVSDILSKKLSKFLVDEIIAEIIAELNGK